KRPGTVPILRSPRSKMGLSPFDCRFRIAARGPSCRGASRFAENRVRRRDVMTYARTHVGGRRVTTTRIEDLYLGVRRTVDREDGGPSGRLGWPRMKSDRAGC